MSYSARLKSALATQDIKSKCCAATELYAFYMMNNKKIFKYYDESFAKRISILAGRAAEYFKAGNIKTENCSNGKASYSVEVFYNQNFDISEIKKKTCCSDAFLRGCFLSSGYVSAPDKPARAEIAFKNSELLEICKLQLEESGIKYNITQKNGRYVIYIKTMTGVSDFLARIGAVGAMLEFENTIILKNYKSEANRVANCDNANLDKIVSAALRQSAIISDFMKTATFETLPSELKEIALLRVENESLSLKELGGMLTPVLSKSGVAHRLKKIEELALKQQK